MSNSVSNTRPGEKSDVVTQTPVSAGERRAGPVQTAVLIAAGCASILGAVLLAPVLPAMQAAFADTPGASTLIPLVLTFPALLIGLLSPVAGRVVDRFGRKRLLIASLVLYAPFGTAPLWLDSLNLILISRIGVGITEAFIMTCCTTLLADYFTGHARHRVFGIQTIVTTFAATVLIAVGGVLGASGWRTPFWLYAASLVVAGLVAAFIWEPSARRDTAAAPLPPLPWRTTAKPVIVTFFGGIVFYALIVELAYVLTARGVTDPASIGAIAAGASLASAIGAFVFTRLSKTRSPRWLLTVAFVLAGVGLGVVGAAPTVPVVIIGAVVSSFGAGLLLPTMLTWALSGLSYAQRGRASGRWTSALFIGEFVCPLLLVVVAGAIGGLNAALIALGVAAVVVGALISRRSMSHGDQEAQPVV